MMDATSEGWATPVRHRPPLWIIGVVMVALVVILAVVGWRLRAAAAEERQCQFEMVMQGHDATTAEILCR